MIIFILRREIEELDSLSNKIHNVYIFLSGVILFLGVRHSSFCCFELPRANQMLFLYNDVSCFKVRTCFLLFHESVHFSNGFGISRIIFQKVSLLSTIIIARFFSLWCFFFFFFSLIRVKKTHCRYIYLATIDNKIIKDRNSGYYFNSKSKDKLI